LAATFFRRKIIMCGSKFYIIRKFCKILIGGYLINALGFDELAGFVVSWLEMELLLPQSAVG